MKVTKSTTAFWAIVLAALMLGCGKKEEAKEAEAAAEGEAPAAAAAAVDEAPPKAEPAEMAAKAVKSRMLDVAWNGKSYVAVGERGHVLRSTDGETWEQAVSPVRSTLTAVYFADAVNGWAGGHDASIIATNDGGKTWKLQHWAPELMVPVLDILFLDAQRGFAVGAYGFYRFTTDGGATWSELADNAAAAEEWHFNGITRLGDGSLLLVGEAGGVAHSKDEGATWTKLTSPYEGTFFGAVPMGPAGAMLYGLRGNVYVIDNPATASPASWRKLETGTYQSLLGGTVLPDGGVVLVGVTGVVYKGDATGLQGAENPGGITLSAVVGDGNMVAAGERGPQQLTLQ